ncbi:MAG TPA: GNAT family N-acetyltransferase [Solirubrobacteraceae bacterium]|nr:GNAT family N-acetyltransferase [Solirubrobacteraceae bacterium]
MACSAAYAVTTRRASRRASASTASRRRTGAVAGPSRGASLGEDAPTYVAESGEAVIGMVTLCVFSTLTGPKAYLDHLVVAPRWRRQGIGRALVQHAIEQAEAAGASRIDLTANEAKQAGRALYQSLGFRQRDTASFRLHIAARRAGRV